jgi:hypothetical protein
MVSDALPVGKQPPDHEQNRNQPPKHEQNCAIHEARSTSMDRRSPEGDGPAGFIAAPESSKQVQDAPPPLVQDAAHHPSVLRPQVYRPVYNHKVQTRPLTVISRFDNAIRLVVFETLRLMANRILEFQCRSIASFAENRRPQLGKVLQQGYGLLFPTGGVVQTWSKVHVGGPCVLFAPAAFMGSINSIMQACTVSLEWC